MDIETNVNTDATNGTPETTYLDKELEATDGGSSTGVEESKDSDYNNSENDSRSSSGKEVKRGKKRKHSETAPVPQRETPRRAATRSAKRYIDDEAYNEIDEGRESDPDYDLSDSDDDPDFDPSKKKVHSISPEFDLKGRRSKGNKAKTKGRMRQSVESTDEDSNSALRAADLNDSLSQKRRGRPPVYQSPSDKQSEEISDNTVSSTDDSQKTAGKLSSAYNYATTRTRQNQAIRLPEGPNLTEEQLKLIESQFKSGDFVMAKKDTDMMENPPIWRIDGKSLLQKFQAFEKDGKKLYRNISTYSGWTAQAKALYVPVKVKFVFQSRYDTVVELIGFKGLDGKDSEPSEIIDKPVWIPKNKDFEISDELKKYMPSFEVYLQTLISQALDNNFLQEIYHENDAYFVDRVKEIDEETNREKKF
ncbi:hypothetical protein Avbf_05688 [Armadillidium vulgare]|nr:hypothetical protein Avbf_05688 [Armadillidium vulgare]